jgi:hypothetical protein
MSDGDNKTKKTNTYRYITIDGECYRADHLAWLYMTGTWPPGEIEHIDGDNSNDRWANLRLAPAPLGKMMKEPIKKWDPILQAYIPIEEPDERGQS